tara:strand:+ start:44 stop:757 length:714 start_codon:yes stop_codon:yes gene_type:complete
MTTNIEKPKNEDYIQEVTDMNNIYYMFFSVMIILWFIILCIFIYNLKNTKSNTDKTFIYLLLIIGMYPFYIYIMTCVKIYKTTNITGLGPEFPICATGIYSLTPEEKALGIIAKINNKCIKHQENFLRNKATTIQKRSLFTIKILFTLIIFLFGFGKTSSFHYKLITNNSYFIRSLIRVACISSLISLTINFFGVDFYYISNIIELLYNALFVISITTIAILITYLLHNFIVNFYNA